MGDHTHNSWIKVALDWIAALLGIGTFAGLVNIVVGVLSGLWIGVQVYGYMRYELPAKRAKLKLIRSQIVPSKSGDLT